MSSAEGWRLAAATEERALRRLATARVGLRHARRLALGLVVLATAALLAWARSGSG